MKNISTPRSANTFLFTFAFSIASISEILNTYGVKERIENDYDCSYEEQIISDIDNVDNVLQFKNNKEQFIQKYKKQIRNITKKDYDNIEVFISKADTVREDNENSTRNKIIDILKKCINNRKINILDFEKDIINISLQKLEKVVNK